MAAAAAGELVGVLVVQSLQTAVELVTLQDSLGVVGQGCPHSRLYCTCSSCSLEWGGRGRGGEEREGREGRRGRGGQGGGRGRRGRGRRGGVGEGGEGGEG